MHPYNVILYFVVLLTGYFVNSKIVLWGVAQHPTLTVGLLVAAAVLLVCIATGVISARVLTGHWIKL